MDWAGGWTVLADRVEAVITVAELGEFGLIAAVHALLPRPADARVLGVGDDAAVIPAADGRVVATTDLLIEGRHFRRDWSGPADIGVKAAAQNLANVAAMGAAPTALLVGMALPGTLPAAWVLDVVRGLVAECQRAGAAIVGGDVTSADSVMLAITALGDLGGRAPVTRGGALPGDVLAISGAVGRSAAGLALLSAGLADRAVRDPGQAAPAAEFVAAHRRPQPDYPAGPLAARAGATAMIDISDGLVQDLGHVAAASGVRIDVDTGSLPDRDRLAGVAALLGAGWPDWALAGGEDHALAATFRPGSPPPAGWTVIGTVSEGAGVWADSRRWDRRGGWDHFR